MVHVQTDFPEYQGARYPAAAHALLPYNPAALSGADLVSSLATSPVYGVAKLARRSLQRAQLRGLGVDPQTGAMVGIDPQTGQPVPVPPPDPANVSGLIADAPVAVLATVAAVGVLLLAAVGYAAYKTGEAVAPPGEESTYGWYGLGAGLVGGPVGLGVLALVGGRNRDE